MIASFLNFQKNYLYKIEYTNEIIKVSYYLNTQTDICSGFSSK